MDTVNLIVSEIGMVGTGNRSDNERGIERGVFFNSLRFFCSFFFFFWFRFESVLNYFRAETRKQRKCFQEINYERQDFLVDFSQIVFYT